MRALFGDFMSRSPLLALPIVALAIFILFFAGTAVRLWRRGAAAYDAQARLPLEEDAHE